MSWFLRRWVVPGLFLLVWCFRALSQPAPLAVGDAVPVIAAKDQHGRDFSSTNGVRFLLVVAERACAEAANQKLAEQGADFLETNRAAYLMDIHTMPAVARWFALPKMRKYPQRIVLVDTAAALAEFPRRAGAVTVLALSPSGRVLKISFWNPESEPVAGFFS